MSSETENRRPIPGSMSRSFLISILAFVLLLVILQQLFLQHPDELLMHALKWMQTHPLLGIAAYGVGFVIWFMLMIPCTPLELLAGYAYGFWAAVAILTFVKPLAHVCTFLAARTVGFADQGMSLEKNSRTFRAVVTALQKPEQAWRIVFLVQLAAVPAGPKDCCLAMVPVVTLPMFTTCALLAGIPFSLANSFLGSSADDLAKALRGEDSGESPEAKRIRLCIMVGGALALLACVTAIGIYTRNALEQLADDKDEESSAIGSHSSPFSSGRSSVLAQDNDDESSPCC